VRPPSVALSGRRTSMRTRRHDPTRRDRIIEATIDSIAEHGVAGTSQRRVAADAGVQVGSLSYHFENSDHLLKEAFTRCVQVIRDQIENRFATVEDASGAVEAAVQLIHEDFQSSRRELILYYELYAITLRSPDYQSLTAGMIDIGQQMLEKFFDQATARAINTYIEGACCYVALSAVPETPAATREMLRRLAHVPA